MVQTHKMAFTIMGRAADSGSTARLESTEAVGLERTGDACLNPPPLENKLHKPAKGPSRTITE